MKPHGPHVLFLVASLSTLPSLSRADTIHRIDGGTIDGVEVLEESLSLVVYKAGNQQRDIPADQVLRVDFKSYPKQLEGAVASVEEEDYLGALDGFEEFVESQIESPRERRKWAAPYAAWQTVQLRMHLGDYAGVVRAASRVIDKFPSSRYVPEAYLAKASAQVLQGEGPAAQASLNAFEAMIGDRSLSKRWELECQVAKIETDTRQSPEAARRALRDVERLASSYPLVASRARVVQGESLLKEAEKSRGKADELRAEARGVFEKVLASAADDSTLAGAYAGIGECLFYSGAGKGNNKELLQAADNFLRVIVLYEGESRYVQKSLFYAMRSFDLMQDRRRQRDMRNELESLYPGSYWAEQAKNF